MTARYWARPKAMAGLLWVACLAASCASVNAQPGMAPADCKSSAGETILSLESRKKEIEGRLAKLQDRMAEVGPVKRAPLDTEMRKAQEDLLELVFAADCLRLKALPPLPPPPPLASDERKRAPMASRGLSPPSPAPVSAAPPQAAAPPGASADRAARGAGPTMEKSASADAVEVVTYYATNRKQGAANAAPSDVYGNERGSALAFGRVVVSIPRTHTPGTIEQPQLWKFERSPDPNKHFVLKSVTPLETDATRGEISNRLKQASDKSMLVFVHGYNNGFEDAALRTAQLAYDLQFPGIPFFYSWPSANRVRSYLQDEETARLSEGVFETVLRELSALPVQSIYIVAHSMGNRVVGHGLQRYVNAGGKTDRIKELLLAAPDINAEIFKDEIQPRLAQMRGTRTTIYASSSDVALIASKVVHGFRRVGESSGGVLVFKGMDTVDASNASPSMRNLGHSYLVDSASVIKDLHSIIASKLAARARGLLPKGQEPEVYWQLPQ
jgi:esterase/lipase superfamily enzyme